MNQYGEYFYFTPEENDGHSWKIFTADMEVLSGKRHKNVKDKIKKHRSLNGMDGYKTAIYTDLPTLTAGTTITFADVQRCQTQMINNGIPDHSEPVYPWNKKKQKKAKAMYNDYDEYETPIQTRTDEQKKRDYLASRLDAVDFTKRGEARKLFHMDAEVPQTVGELVDVIKAGKFTLDEKYKKTSAYSFWSFIDWHDPAAPADEAGYRAVRDAFKKLKTETQDQIKIADPADGLKALQALEAWTPTTAAN